LCGISGDHEDEDVTLRRLALADRKIDVRARFCRGPGSINVPYFSPDGSRIAFVTYHRGE
jgi:hypothetical protein